MNFGDVVSWRDTGGSRDYTDGRYMVIGPGEPDILAETLIEVVCLLPPKKSLWEVGETAPCRPDEMEVVRE